MDERRRDAEKERERDRERRVSETDVPKLYPTINMNSLCSEKMLNSLFILSPSPLFPTFTFKSSKMPLLLYLYPDWCN